MRIFLAFFLLLAHMSPAQHYCHWTLWTRLQVNHAFSEKWDVQAEYHYRRQDNFSVENRDFTNNKNLDALRLYAYYRNKNFVFGISPLMYIHSHQLLGKPSDFDVPPNREVRLATFLEDGLDAGKLKLLGRMSYELRLLKNRADIPISRYRPRVGFRYLLAKTTTLIGYNDLALQHIPDAPSFNFNQLYLALNHRINKQVNAEVGYFNIHRQRRNAVEFDEENVLSATLIVRL